MRTKRAFSATIMCCLAVLAVSSCSSNGSRLSEQVTVNASAEASWKVVASYCDIAAWHPAVLYCDANWGNNHGSTRVLTLQDGAQVTERLDEYDAAGKSYTYTITEPGPLPVSNYVSSISVRDNGGGSSTVTWESNFDTPNGVTDEDADKAMAGVYTGGLGQIKMLAEMMSK